MKTRMLLPLSMLMISPTYAGGLYLYEVATDDVGLAAAGIAARAQDATVMFMNPAGISRLEGSHLSVGAQALYGNVPYNLNDPTLNDVDNAMGWFPAASFFYSTKLNERWSIGMATYGNFGLGLDYGDWAGANLMKDVTLMALTFQPTLAYQINEQWSVGAGLGINYGIFSITRAKVPNDEELDDHDWAYNAKLGVLYQLNEHTRFGLGYSSATEYQFAIDTQVTVPIPGKPVLPDINARVPIEGIANSPQQLMFSAFHQINSDWAFLTNIGWQDWSAYSDNHVFAFNQEVAGTDRVRDVYHFAAGSQYSVNPQLTINTGIAFDTSVYKTQNNTSLTMPSGAALRLGAGVKYALDSEQSIGTAFEYIAMDSAKVQNEALAGRYPNSDLYFLSANYSLQF